MSPLALHQIYEFLGIAVDQTLQREAIAFVYRNFSEGEHKMKTITAAIDETSSRIQPRLDMFNNWAPDFFKDKTSDRNALLIAVICDDFVEEANNLERDDDDNPPVGIRKDFQDDRAIGIAVMLFDQATGLNEHGLLEGEAISEEAFFLAHINAIEDLAHKLDTLDQYEYDELIAMQKGDIDPAKSFLRKDTAIGQELSSLIDELEEAIAARLPKVELYSLPANPVIAIAPDKMGTENAQVLSFPLFKRQSDPVLYLLEKHAPFKTEGVKNAIYVLWESLYDRNDEDYSDTMAEADALIERKTCVFTSYREDYDLSEAERETALCAWLMHSTVDIQDDRYWNMISEKTGGILAALDSQELRYPVLSDSFDDKTLELCIGLHLITGLTDLHEIYARGRWRNFKFDEISIDQHHCLRLLQDAVPVTSRLVRDIREKASAVLLEIAKSDKRQIFSIVK